jgi:D-tyrosyl-tRNA(Tyr) deacylase
MRALIQRVLNASVSIDGVVKSSINKGLLIFVGITHDDTVEDIKWLSSKIINLRIFEDQNQMMNLNVNDVNAQLLVVSQFTLHASTKKGNRPSFINAAKPEQALDLYLEFIQCIQSHACSEVVTGEFGADMKVSLINDGPVTIIMDSKSKE